MFLSQPGGVLSCFWEDFGATCADFEVVEKPALSAGSEKLSLVPFFHILYGVRTPGRDPVGMGSLPARPMPLESSTEATA